MKRFGYILSGMITGGLASVALAWMLGFFFGPLYQGEDESTRNFKIFLMVFVLFIIMGAYIAYKITGDKAGKKAKN